jgi:hypothetical protein
VNLLLSCVYVLFITRVNSHTLKCHCYLQPAGMVDVNLGCTQSYFTTS